ncbi:MAG: hypothetical protein OHK0024_01060 [Thalassobaculales bacterium]
MVSEADNLVLEPLRAIRGELTAIHQEQREQRERLSSIERMLTHFEQNFAVMNARFDRMHDRLDRIERRLELAPA